MLLADFHIHSTFSDGRLTIPEIIDFYGHNGFDVIAITDHLCDNQSFLGLAANYLDKTLTQDSYSFYLDMIEREAQRARDLYNMIVLPGVEYTKNSLLNSRSAHILGLNVGKFIDPALNVKSLSAKIRNEGGLSVVAHPVWTRRFEPQTFHIWDRRKELSHDFDAWEVASGSVIFDEVAQSGLPLIANSDFHHSQHMTSWKTLLNCKKNVSDIMNAIRQQKLKFTYFKTKVNYQSEGKMSEFWKLDDDLSEAIYVFG